MGMDTFDDAYHVNFVCWLVVLSYFFFALILIFLMLSTVLDIRIIA